MRRLILPFAAVLLLAACSPTPAPAPDAAPASAGTPADAPASAMPDPVRDPAPAAPATSPAPAATDAGPPPTSPVAVALDGEGLRLVDAATGSTRLLAFRSDAQAVRAALARALPGLAWTAPQETDCGDSVVSSERGLNLHERDGRFLGWSLGAASPLTTMAGIGIGATRAQLEAAQVPEVMDSTLGTEFVAGGVAGLLESGAATARITHLWAGETCIAR